MLRGLPGDLRMTPRALKVCALGFLGLAMGYSFHEASAQRFDPQRPTTFLVGPPPGIAPMQRTDARRSGMAPETLPQGTLRIAWRTATSTRVEHPALAHPDGVLSVLSMHGDVTFLDAEGQVLGSAHANAPLVGPATLTSNGALLFMTSNGDVVLVRRAREPKVAKRRLGGELNVRTAPLGLEDGGAVLATSTELVLVDSEGGARARAAINEPIAAPLLAWKERVLAVTERGNVFSWRPREEPHRLGSFGGPIDTAATLTSEWTLSAIVDEAQLVELDLRTGLHAVRSSARMGERYLGPLSASWPESTLAWRGLWQGRGFALRLGVPDAEHLSVPIEVLDAAMASSLADAGAGRSTPLASVGPLVDERGSIAFVTTGGRVGVVRADGTVETLGERVCPTASRGAPTVAGLTPLGESRLAVTCTNGEIICVEQARL
jgi:hypothetical protein